MKTIEILKTKRGKLAGLSLVLVLIIIIVLGFGNRGGSTNLPTAVIDEGQFIVSITETGELKATNSQSISAPRVHTSLQIVYLAEKGKVVEAGDTLAIFDGTELQKTIDEKISEVEIANSNLEKSRASMASSMAQLEASLKTTQASYRQSELRLEQMKFEADVVKEEQELTLLQSKINLEQAEKKIEQQQIIDKAELVTLELRVKQAEADLGKARLDLQKLTLTASTPGLVVYKKIWKGGDMGEVRVGDTPWRGQGILELPDLSQMEVATSVNEVDVSKIKSGQSAKIILDAFPERVFSGEVVDVSTLARIEEESAGEVKVFDVTVKVLENDEILKPGMTVSAEIIIETVEDVVWAPIDAVFTAEDKNVIYKKSGGGFKEIEVELGTRNDNFVVIKSNIKPGDAVCLVDPNKPFDENAWVGGSESGDKKKNNGHPANGNGNK